MAVIERQRTLRPSSRKPTSRYRVRCRDAHRGDTLRLEVSHERHPAVPIVVLEFHGETLIGCDSIYFRATEDGKRWRLDFSPVPPSVVTV